MHLEASSYVADIVQQHHLHGDVLELGGRNVNGGLRTLVPHDWWLSVDIAPGDDVDLVTDAADLELPQRFDVVICTEVLEHTPRASEIVAAAWWHLREGGMFVATMAGPGRAPHSATDGGMVKGGEFYRNVEPGDLEIWLGLAGFVKFDVNVCGADVRCWAYR